MDPAAALAYIDQIALQTSATLSYSSLVRHVPAHRIVGEAVPVFISRLRSLPRATRRLAVTKFVGRVSRYGCPLIEGSTAYFFYAGRGHRISVPGDLNDWDPSKDVMSRIAGTNLHYLARSVPRGARIEYRYAADGTWILDPYNQQLAVGGSGPNSELAMPPYRPPAILRRKTRVPHGVMDSISFSSTALKRSHPIFVYRPHGYDRSERQYPSLYVLDGGDYLSLGLMAAILDIMISQKLIRPLVAIFLDPRTDVTRPRTNKRTTDYTMNDSFVHFLAHELRPHMDRSYRLIPSARKRGIMGASLGGLIATYAAFQRPHVFGFCATQSPSYWWKNRAMISKIAEGSVKPVRFYLDTGIIQDSLDTARAMRAVLERKHYRYKYAEFPEGHNWGNWRARIPNILQSFQEFS